MTLVRSTDEKIKHIERMDRYKSSISPRGVLETRSPAKPDHCILRLVLYEATKRRAVLSRHPPFWFHDLLKYQFLANEIKFEINNDVCKIQSE